MFGAQAPISVRTAVTVRRLRWVGRGRRHAAGHLLRVQRLRSGTARAPVDPRADGHRRPVPALRRPRRGHRLAVRALPGRRAADRGAHVPGRCPGRRRQRIDTALDRARCSGPEARRGWRPLRPRAGSAHDRFTARWPRPGVRPSDRVHASGARSTSDDRHARRHRRTSCSLPARRRAGCSSFGVEACRT